MKKLVIVWVLLIACMSSCLNLLSPKDYEEDIQDAVKYHIAMADYIIELAQNPFLGEFLGVFASGAIEEQIDKMETAINDLYTKEDWTYEQVLTHIAKDNHSDYQDDAKKILKHYKGVNISLSDYVKSSTREDYKSWKFKELHSGVEFLFELKDVDSENTIWVCSPIEKSYEEYVSNGAN